MIAFLFPIVLGALIGFTLDDGNIDKSDFTNIKKELVNPISDSLVGAKNRIVKAYEGISSEGIPKRK